MHALQDDHPRMASRPVLLSVLLACPSCGGLPAADEAAEDQTAPTASVGAECADPAGEWIWCDDFEVDRLASYFEYDDGDGNFTRTERTGVDGSFGMQARFAEGQVAAGSLHLALGRTPQDYFRPVDEGVRRYRDLYWRLWVRTEPDWVGGGGYKLTRAMSFASTDSWAQAMIAHVWSGSSPSSRDYLVIDPASGTDEGGRVITTTYNDFDHLRWLGARQGVTPIFGPDGIGRWHCIEAHVRLNDPDRANGVFELWIDENHEAGRADLDWVGAFEAYGINAVFLENYWNDGSPTSQERYFDNLVVSTSPIGC